MQVIVLAIPWSGVQKTLQNIGDFAGKILIDPTNPFKGMQLSIGFTTSAGEEVAKFAKNARVVKAFNTCGWKIMANPVFGNEKADMYIAGDDAVAKKVVCDLAADLGFEPVDVGPLSQARLLEPMAQLWVHLAYAANWGPYHAFKLLRREPEKK
jgi:predicted dinucleotide-binding enzyme